MVLKEVKISIDKTIFYYYLVFVYITINVYKYNKYNFTPYEIASFAVKFPYK